MPIRFRCHSCNAKIKVPDGSAGRKVKCPRCGTTQDVRDEIRDDASEASNAPETTALGGTATPLTASPAPAERPTQPVSSPAVAARELEEDGVNPLAALAAAAGDDVEEERPVQASPPMVQAPAPKPVPPAPPVPPVAVAPPSPVVAKAVAPPPPPAPVTPREAEEPDPAAALAAAAGATLAVSSASSEAPAVRPVPAPARPTAPKPIALSSTPVSLPSPVSPAPPVIQAPAAELPAFTLDQEPEPTPEPTPRPAPAPPKHEPAHARTVIKVPAYTGMSLASWFLRILAVLLLAGAAKLFMMVRDVSVEWALLSALLAVLGVGIAWGLGEAVGGLRDIARNSHKR